MKILVSDGISPEGAKILTDAMHTVDIKKLSPEELLKNISEYDAILVRSATKVTKEVIDAGVNLKVIARGGVGLDNIDVEHAKTKNIMVLNTPAASSISVAELAIGQMFALTRYLHVSKMEMVQGKWPKKEYSAGTELFGKTLGIFGLGNIGKEVARRGMALGMRVIAFDPPLSPMDFMVEITTREKLLAKADFISMHVPFNKKLGPVIGKAEIEMMKKGVVLINCSRGGVIDEVALLEGLNSGKVRAAGLDVFADEPPSAAQKALIDHPNVCVTPHIGGSTVEAQDRVGTEIAVKIVKAFNPRED